MTTRGLLTSTWKQVPLQSISVDVVIRGFVADVASILQYHNGETDPVEVQFVFPLDAEASVYAFEGLIGGTPIETQIREKKQAEQEYDDALSEGREAFVLERDERASDIFMCILGNLPPDGEAILKLRYVQALAPEPDGALRFVLPAVLNPRYAPQGSERGTVTENIPRVPKGQLPYTLSLNATVESPCVISHVESQCALKPLRYTAENHTAAQIALADGHQFDRDVELLIYYSDIHKPSALLEAGKPEAPPGSLMADPALLLTLYPEHPTSESARSATGEFIFLLDRSISMDYRTRNSSDSPSRIQSAKETLVFLLKSLPLGCYFNIYGFGSHYDSFYAQSVEYTQQTMSESLERIKKLDADLGGTEILLPLKEIYNQPCQEGHPRQALQSLKKAVQPVVTGVSLCWDLPSGLEAVLVGRGPSVIFPGHRCLVFAQIHGQLQSADVTEGAVVLQYTFHDQIFTETLRFPLRAQESDRLLIHRLAAQALLQELERAGEMEEEKKHLALETSLSSGVVCSQTAYIGINKEMDGPVQGPLVHQEVPLLLDASKWEKLLEKDCCFMNPDLGEVDYSCSITSYTNDEESPFFSVVSLQNADGSWSFDSALSAWMRLMSHVKHLLRTLAG